MNNKELEQIGESIWDTCRSIGKILGEVKVNPLSRKAIKMGAGGRPGSGDTDLAARKAEARAKETRAKGYGVKTGVPMIKGGSGTKTRPTHKLTIAKEPRVGPKQHKKGK
jgi:hypothetical protein